MTHSGSLWSAWRLGGGNGRRPYRLCVCYTLEDDSTDTQNKHKDPNWLCCLNWKTNCLKRFFKWQLVKIQKNKTKATRWELSVKGRPKNIAQMAKHTTKGGQMKCYNIRASSAVYMQTVCVCVCINIHIQVDVGGRRKKKKNRNCCWKRKIGSRRGGWARCVERRMCINLSDCCKSVGRVCEILARPVLYWQVPDWQKSRRKHAKTVE